MNIGIVGLGLIGGSYAKSLIQYPYKIYGIDIDKKAINYALKNKLINLGSTDPSSVLGELDIVFLCLYPNSAIKFVNDNMRFFKRGAIISDVVGIKRKMVDAFDIYKNDDIEFVFAHPIAGKEKIGIEHSDEAIFIDSNFVITPTNNNTDEAINLITVLAKQMGFKNVTLLSDVLHDDIIAYTSQLTHAIAISLINSDDKKLDTKLFMGDSYKDLTRIAQINDDLWAELFINNKDFLIKHIDKFENELSNLKEIIRAKDKEKLKELMKLSTIRREKLNE